MHPPEAIGHYRREDLRATSVQRHGIALHGRLETVGRLWRNTQGIVPVRAPSRQIGGWGLVRAAREIQQRTPAGPEQLQVEIAAHTKLLDIIYEGPFLGERNEVAGQRSG